MRKTTGMLAMVLVCTFALADVIALRNGKQMIIPGTYEIKGAYVVFEDARGQLVQLPLKMVDLEKSKELTDAYKAEMAEKAKRAAQKPKEEKDAMSMSEIAEIVESKRPKDQPPPRVVLGTDRLKKFSEERPLPQNDAMPIPEYEPLTTVEGQIEARKEFSAAYQKLNSELTRLDAALDSAQKYADALAQESAFGDDPTGSVYEAMETADKAVEEIRAKKQEKEAELQKLENNARKAGIRNYKNSQAGRRPAPAATDSQQQNDGSDQEQNR